MRRNKEKKKMRKIALFAAVAAAAVAVPAAANEARVEARGGVAWAEGEEEAILGVAAGYDFDLGTGAFAGVEVSADKLLVDGADVTFGFNARGGAKLASGTKLYAITGYQTEPCEFCTDSWSLGAGVEMPISSNFYGKVEYRHFFAGEDYFDTNAATVGLGMKF
jgi:opacity protein-like surface antigen